MTEIQLKAIIKIIAKKLLNEGLQGLTKEELNDIVNLRYIHGVGTLEKLEFSKKLRLEIYNFVLRKCRWILNFQYPFWEGNRWEAPFTHFFQSGALEYEDWLQSFQDEIREQLNWVQTWLKHEKPPENNWYHLKIWETAHQIAKQYPTFEQDLKNLYEFVSLQRHNEPQVGWNDKNYPLFVSLYSSSREYGGPEEGGWHYTHNEYIESIPVKNYKEARKAVVHLLKNMTRGFEGTQIVLEKTPRSIETRERPHYS